MIDMVIVEDDLLFREVLVDILNGTNINIVAFASTENEAVEYAIKYQPEIVLMDIHLKEGVGINAVKKIESFKKENNSNMKIIILSVFYNKEYVDVALDLNVAGYILKEDIKEKLLHTIKSTMLGIVSLDKKVIETNRLFNDETCGDINKKLNILTKREKEIIGQIAKGHKNVQIANELQISQGRVKNIITVINQKIETKNSKEIAVFGFKSGLIR